MYENATADRLTVYVTASLPDKANASEFTQVDGLDAFYWANNLITCTVVGNLPEAEMQTVARRVFQQLSWRPDRPYRG
jgi:anti-sigma factor RsiW